MDDSSIGDDASVDDFQAVVDESWSGFCLDDGTGRNIYYVSHKDGSRSRAAPTNFTPEIYETGDRRYYFRGECILCRKKEFPSILSRNKESELFALNICSSCILDSCHIPKLKGHGDKVWEIHRNTPKCLYINAKALAIDPEREQHLLARAKTARFSVQIQAKKRRDLERWNRTREIAASYHIIFGTYISWGIGKVFDEYYGGINDDNLPHGEGVKVYSDGTLYAGMWNHGARHTSTTGIWSRPDGYEYEGTWVSDMKHGTGKVVYPDGSTYIGEFARDSEHGHGILYYVNDTSFEGRFRFGKRDGHGTIHYPDGTSTKDNFRDYLPYFTEKPVPRVNESEDEDAGDIEFIQPDSLLKICYQAVAMNVRLRRHLVSSKLMRLRLSEHLKPFVALQYLSTRHPKPSQKFVEIAPALAFVLQESLEIDSIVLSSPDIETLLYFQNSNHKLEKLRLIATKLDSMSISLLWQAIGAKYWPLLRTLDLSFNTMKTVSLRGIIQVVAETASIQVLRLSGCKIYADGAFIIAMMLESNHNLTDLDLSFNYIQGTGAESLAEALSDNESLTSLNLRQNNLGELGGKSMAHLLKINKTIQTLCLADNEIGSDSMSLVSGRMMGNIRNVMTSVRVKELHLPSRYESLDEEDA